MSPKLRNAALLFLAGMLVVHGYAFWNVRRLVLTGYADFTSFYGAGKTIRLGHATRLYDAAEQWTVQQTFAPRVEIRKGPLPYLRPPFEALLFVPLTFLPYSAAYLLWFAFNLCVVIAAALVLRREIPFFQGWPPWLLPLLALAFTPVFLALLQGQDCILLLLLYCLAFVALERDADILAGCVLGLGLFKPHLVLPFVLLLWLQSRKKVLIGLLAVGLALFLVSLAMVGWPVLLHYPAGIWWLEQHTQLGLVPPDNTPNIRGLIEGFLSGSFPHWATTALIAVISIALFLWAAMQKKAAMGSIAGIRTLVFCQALVVTFLVSYHAFAYDLSVMLLPIGLLLAQFWTEQRQPAKWDSLAFLGPMAILLFGPVYPILWFRFHALNLMAIVLLIWAWGISRELGRLQAELSSTGTVMGSMDLERL